MTKVGFRKAFIIIFQVVVVLLAFSVAVLLVNDGQFPYWFISEARSILVPLVFAKLFIFALVHLFTGWWRYVSIHDLVALVNANVIGSLLFAFYVYYLPGNANHVTVSLLIVDGFLCFLFMSGARVSVRLCREYFTAAHKACGNGIENVLIVGSGATGQSIAREIQQNPHLNWKAVGYVDQDVNRINIRFQGIPVLASIEALETILDSMSINLVVLANPSLCHKELRNIVELCRKCGTKSKILPNVEAILNDGVSIHHIRDVKFEDLLGRPSVNLDVLNIRKYLENKKVLVTGAAGSIGSELCRQIAGFGADTLIFFDNAETPLFNIERELKKKFPKVRFVACLGDIRDTWQVDSTFRAYQPEVVFHAAAYKHVPMSEENPLTAIGNNVLGTRVVANAADRFNVNHFVMISTDKAVNPTNIMGASKRAAEIYVQSLAKASKTKMVTVRFGNVLGSNGSVVPIFQEQILNGGPVTVTDPEVTRFFMTIPEAVQLVLQAGSMGEGEEIFVLDMGKQVKISFLAEELIRLSGMTPNKDIDIVYTGLRPGEKLHEELVHNSEGLLETNHEKICVAKARSHNIDDLDQLLVDLAIACRTINMKQAISIVTTLVPEYDLECGLLYEKSIPFMLKKSKIIKFPVNVLEKASDW